MARHLQALQSGQAAAAVTFEPLAGAIEAAGFRRIFDSRELPGEVLDVLVVRVDVLEQRPDAVDALLRAWYAGLALFNSDLPGAAESLARGTDLTPDAYQAVLAGLAFHSREASASDLSGNPPPLADKASTVADALQSIGLLQRTPRWQDLIDGAPMQRLQAGGKAP